MKQLLFVIAIVVILLLSVQYRLWIDADGYQALRQLQQELAQQRAKNQELRQQNRQLQAEVNDLKQGLAAIEERAREDLGMIKDGETFIQVIDPPTTPGSAPTP